MKVERHISEAELAAFKSKALQWASTLDQTIVCLDSNTYRSDNYARYEFLLAIGAKEQLICSAEHAFEKLEAFNTKFSNEWKFGYLSYDLKNDVEDLRSENHDGIQASALQFIVPKLVIGISPSYEVFIEGEHDTDVWDAIWNLRIEIPKNDTTLDFMSRVSKASYVKAVQSIKEHILDGDVYEMNYCMELFQESIELDPLNLYLTYNDRSKSPFASFIRMNDHYLICASPERFIQKNGSTIISQPIKGTIKRGRSSAEDEELVQQLKNDPKERAENVMIVDLVRNDLARSCASGSIQVDELFGIYPFTFVHQMISTVSGQLQTDVSGIKAIKNAFPMGSMTGAPKVKAMELIEHFEDTKRGIYSGAVGYFDPSGDFDFNVVIRSFVYNQHKKYLGYIVGSAITIDSEPEKEYEECLLKAKGII